MNQWSSLLWYQWREEDDLSVLLMFSPMYHGIKIINIKEYWFDDAVIGLLLVLSPMYGESMIITIVVSMAWRSWPWRIAIAKPYVSWNMKHHFFMNVGINGADLGLLLMLSRLYHGQRIINIKEYCFDDAVIRLLLMLIPIYYETIFITIVVFMAWRRWPMRNVNV